MPGALDPEKTEVGGDRRGVQSLSLRQQFSLAQRRNALLTVRQFDNFPSLAPQSVSTVHHRLVHLRAAKDRNIGAGPLRA